MSLTITASAGQKDVTRRGAGTLGVVLIAGFLQLIIVWSEFPQWFAPALGQLIHIAHQQFAPAAGSLSVLGIAFAIPGPVQHAFVALQRMPTAAPAIVHSVRD